MSLSLKQRPPLFVLRLVDALLSAGLWVNIQLCSAIICACLPTYRPILPRGAILSSTLSQWHSLLSRRSRASTSRSSEGNTKDYSKSYTVSDGRARYARYNNISDGAVNQIVLTDIKTGNEVDHDYPPNTINVETDLSTHERYV